MNDQKGTGKLNPGQEAAIERLIADLKRTSGDEEVTPEENYKGGPNIGEDKAAVEHLIADLKRTSGDEEVTNRMVLKDQMILKDHEQRLMRISREIHDIAKAIYQIGDNVAAGELMQIEIVLRAFAIDPALRAREDGERTSKEWSQFGKFMLHLIETHQRTTETILGLLKATESSEEKSTEEMKNDDDANI
jgi:hypothetical protein